MTSNIRYTVDGLVARIELARPEKKNAITSAMYGELAAAIGSADESRTVRAVLVHGAPGCFTAGNDLQDFLQQPMDDNSPLAQFLHALPSMKKPIVAAVDGPAVGIGTTMLLHCDLVYATPGARFQLPFAPLGIVPEFGSSYVLPLIAGYQRAAEVLLLGQPFGADKAKELGFVTEVVAAEKLMTHAESAAKTLAGLPPTSILLTKQLLKNRHRQALSNTIAEERRIIAERRSSAEAKEAMSAFLEKRKPDFSRF